VYYYIFFTIECVIKSTCVFIRVGEKNGDGGVGGGEGTGVHTITVDFRRFDMRQVSLIANPRQCPVPARTASFARL
jgi:hypothetical protein